jgi:hypothetical protein
MQGGWGVAGGRLQSWRGGQVTWYHTGHAFMSVQAAISQVSFLTCYRYNIILSSCAHHQKQKSYGTCLLCAG